MVSRYKSSILCNCLYRFFLPFLIILFLFSRITAEETLVLCIDTSGSMKIQERIEAAKKACIRQIEKAKQGDKIFLISFDTYARPLGKLEIGEDSVRNDEAKREMIQKISQLQAKGPWTHLEQAVMMGKTILLDERELRGSKILIFSDGISDPAPWSGVNRISLNDIAKLIPESLGILVYMISFPEDLEAFFDSPIQSSEPLANPVAPHIKGIPVTTFSTEEIEKAIDEVRENKQEIAISHENTQQEPNTSQQETKEQFQEELPKHNIKGSLADYFIFFPVAILTIIGLIACVKWKRPKKIFSLTLKTETEQKSQEFPIDLMEGKRISIGPSGDIRIGNEEQLPPILFSLQMKKEKILIVPQDEISLNGLPITSITQIIPGDVIGARSNLLFKIMERRDE